MAKASKRKHHAGHMSQHPNAGEALAAPDTAETIVEETTSQETGRTLQLREEELRARKQPVETGRVRVGKEVIEEQQTLEVPVTREEVTIERHPVNPTPSDAPIGQGEAEIRVPVREEHVSIEKRPVVTEEVRVGKRQVQQTQQVSGTVRREEARIEGQGDVEVERRA
jgi:uncharacterized protein (TIGR02271 family)